MIYVISKSNKPQYNIALEEYCFNKLRHHDKVFMLWINEPSIIVGKHQNTLEEINTAYVREHGIHVVRRISGGGAVYHDHNNLNYTIISNEEKGSEFDFKSFAYPVIDTLASLGVKAEFSGRNDLLIDGKKISGVAQAYKNGRIMHHGCILFNTELSVLSKALEIPKDLIESAGVKSVRSRVDNILGHLPVKISVEDFSERILAQMKTIYPDMTEYVFSEDELAEVDRVSREKFGSWEWNYGNSPKYTITRNTRFTAGKVQIFATVKNSVIEHIKFYGTFFGNNADLQPIEEALVGVKYTRESVLKILAALPVADYFAGFSVEELAEAVVE